ncbi:MAG: MBL fold metallo-hydrolase [Candidatus Azobacteroides sp.]|nr:MBL fold metallo-hydrolase [Candidatus Azobacteroides sp.]
MKFLLKLTLMSTLLSIANQSFAQEEKNIFKYMVGDCEVVLLSDGQSTGNAGILVGTTPSMLEKCIPDGTFPNAYNAFLVKIQGKNILIDTGLGSNLFKNLEAININPSQIDAVLITHMHGDHIGGLLQNGQVMFPNADIYISQQEYNYWTSDEAAEKAPENRRGGFDQARAVVNAYKDKVKLFETDALNGNVKEIMPSVAAIAAPGHTPGHTMYMISSNDQKMLFWGDLTHAMAIQMPYPDVAVTYDTNPEQAIETRKKVLDYVSKNNISIAGMHLPFPAMGTITSKGTGYVFEKF